MERDFSRHISWLKFNSRVLEQSERDDFALPMRLAFCGIYLTNLDEFYMTRVSNLKALYQNGVKNTHLSSIDLHDELEEINAYIKNEAKYLKARLLCLLDQCAQKGIKIATKVTKEDVEEHFYKNIYPALVPIILEGHEVNLPHFENLALCIAVHIRQSDSKKIAFVKIPKKLPNFYVSKELFIPTLLIIEQFLDVIFDGFEILESLAFRITRQADIEIEQIEADDLIALMEEGLRARKIGRIWRLECLDNSNSFLRTFLESSLNLDGQDVFVKDNPLLLDASCVFEICAHLSPNQEHERLASELDIFSELDKRDIMLFHPYDSFDLVDCFIERACLDECVLSIKMTLYRVGKNSKIVENLIQAAKTKQVTVLVELKARFDEENNLHWAKALEAAGAHVIYSIPNIKVHAKATLIVKKDSNSKIKTYSHLSSGNYNALSAQCYTDVALLSSQENISSDLARLFGSLSIRIAPSFRLEHLSVAPTQIKQKLLALIEQEKSELTFKTNALSDKDIICALKDASKRGVKINLIVRGICTLVPDKNIRVISIIGRYLEHARVYFFKSGDKIFFSSADLMPRNLSRRIELLIPVCDEILKSRLKNYLDCQLRDNLNAYVLRRDGKYIKIESKDELINSQDKETLCIQ